MNEELNIDSEKVDIAYDYCEKAYNLFKDWNVKTLVRDVINNEIFKEISSYSKMQNLLTDMENIIQDSSDLKRKIKKIDIINKVDITMSKIITKNKKNSKGDNVSEYDEKKLKKNNEGTYNLNYFVTNKADHSTNNSGDTLSQILDTVKNGFLSTNTFDSKNVSTIFDNKLKEIINNTGAKIVDACTFLFQNSDNNRIEKSVDNNKKIKTSSFNYEELFDISYDEKKLFGDDTTMGYNGERIVYDKIYKYDDGSRVYKNDGLTVKTVTKECVTIGNNTYYKDGTYTVKRIDCGEWEFVLDFYEKDGRKVKSESRGYGQVQIDYYNESGVITNQKISYDGKNIEIIKNENGETVKRIENGVLRQEFKENKIIYYNVKGIVELEEEKLSDRTIVYNKIDNTKQIKYNNGIIENYSQSNELISTIDENGIESKYYFTENNKKVVVKEIGFKELEITYYDKKGNIKYKTRGTCGGTEAGKNDTRIPFIGNDIITEVYDKDGNVTLTVAGNVKFNSKGNIKTIYRNDGTKLEYDDNGSYTEYRKNGTWTKYDKKGNITNYQNVYNKYTTSDGTKICDENDNVLFETKSRIIDYRNIDNDTMKIKFDDGSWIEHDRDGIVKRSKK